MDYDAIIREFYIRNGANYFPLGTGVTIAGEKQNVSRVFQVSFSICLFNSRPLQQSGSETAIQVAACCLQELPAACCLQERPAACCIQVAACGLQELPAACCIQVAACYLLCHLYD